MISLVPLVAISMKVLPELKLAIKFWGFKWNCAPFPNSVKKGSDSERKEFNTEVHTKHIIDTMIQTISSQVEEDRDVILSVHKE